MKKFLSANTTKRSIVIMSKLVKIMVKLWVSIFRFNVNSEFTFDEQWMKETLLWISFDVFQKKIFFPKFELINSGCGFNLTLKTKTWKILSITLRQINGLHDIQAKKIAKSSLVNLEKIIFYSIL